MRFLFSGLAGGLQKELSLAGLLKSIMPSFWYPNVDLFIDNSDFCVVDSGAHTLQENGYVSEKDFLKYSEKYFNYINSIPKKQGLFFVELDVDPWTNIPLKLVDKVYSKLSTAPNPVLRVWHENRGINTYLDYLEKYKYVGISLLDGIKEDKLFFLTKKALEKRVKLHGFGCGKPKTMLAYPFYSTDASSWARSMAFNGFLKWNEKKINFTKILISVQEQKELSHEHVHLQTTKKYLSLKEKDDRIKYFELHKRSLNEFIKMEKFITEVWAKRGVVWND